MDRNPVTPPIDTTFAQLLQHHRHGHCLDESSQALRDLMAAVATLGGPGKVSLTITVSPAGADGALLIEDAITIKLPKAKAPSSVFFRDPLTGAISRENPAQRQLPFEEVDRAKAG
jgi:hypothetical protein